MAFQGDNYAKGTLAERPNIMQPTQRTQRTYFNPPQSQMETSLVHSSSTLSALYLSSLR